MNNISFIIPAYNCESTIGESIDSILNQNLEKNDEIIIVDDASTDNTLTIIKEYAEKIPQIKYLKHNYNKGSAAAGRNTAIDFSTNELLFCLDADNILVPRSIDKLKKFLFQNNADASSFGEIRYFKNSVGNITHTWKMKDRISFIDNINSGDKAPCASGNYLFTKESWIKAGRYNEFVGGAYDSWAFGLAQLANGSVMLSMPDSYYLHRAGYESTYVLENKKINSSINVARILIPYLHLIDEQDINYIFSKKHRFTWWDNIKKRPLIANNREVSLNEIYRKENDVLSSIKNLIGSSLKKFRNR